MSTQPSNSTQSTQSTQPTVSHVPTVPSNGDFAQTLAVLAAIYMSNPTLPILSIHQYTWSKDELIVMLKGLGGKWIKSSDDSEYLRFTSPQLPGVTLTIPRDKVCKRIVTWDCEPLLSPDEENEVTIIAQGGDR